MKIEFSLSEIKFLDNLWAIVNLFAPTEKNDEYLWVAEFRINLPDEMKDIDVIDSYVQNFLKKLFTDSQPDIVRREPPQIYEWFE